MSTSTVRLLCADPENHDRGVAQGDGTTVEFRLAQSPVVAGSESVRVEGALKVQDLDDAIDTETGVVILTVAPPVPVDPDKPNVVITYRHTLLSDASLQALLTLEGGNDKLAAAAALDVMASSEALVQKKIRLLDLQTDGPAVAAALREHAKRLRDQVADGTGADPAAMFDVAELVVDDFSARERLRAEALRSW
jgi:hypothetical protein